MMKCHNFSTIYPPLNIGSNLGKKESTAITNVTNLIESIMTRKPMQFSVRRLLNQAHFLGFIITKERKYQCLPLNIHWTYCFSWIYSPQHAPGNAWVHCQNHSTEKPFRFLRISAISPTWYSHQIRLTIEDLPSQKLVLDKDFFLRALLLDR
jgi:hypothetical protein